MNELSNKGSPEAKKRKRVPPGQQVIEDMPVLHHGSVQRINPEKWRFRITGLVDRKLELSLDQFRALPQSRVLSDVHCVTGWSRLDNVWEGVLAEEIGKLVRIQPEAKFVIVHSAGGFSTNLTMNDFFQPDVIFAMKHNGEALTPEHGYPVRLVVPKLYFWKSAKWVEAVEFSSDEKLGFWETQGYHKRGDPWKEERYSYQQ